MNTRRSVIAIKQEVTAGTDVTPAAANANMVVFDLKFNPDVKTYDRNAMSASLSPMAPIMGGRSAQVTFSAELKGSGASYMTTPPAIEAALKGCGFAVSGTTAASSIVYKPASTGVMPVTIYFYMDGVLHKVVGAAGNVSISGKIGEPIIASFTFTGVYTGTTDVAVITPSALETTVPPACIGPVVTLGGYTPIISSFSFDLGNTVALRESMGAANGFISANITNRKPTGKLDPEMVLVATNPFYSSWLAGTPAALTIGPVGGTTNNKCTITAPVCVATGIGSSERNGTAALDYSFTCVMNTGDDELVLSFT
jgi:hypothetical protein